VAYLTLGHDRFLSHSFQFIVNQTIIAGHYIICLLATSLHKPNRNSIYILLVVKSNLVLFLNMILWLYSSSGIIIIINIFPDFFTNVISIHGQVEFVIEQTLTQKTGLTEQETLWK